VSAVSTVTAESAVGREALADAGPGAAPETAVTLATAADEPELRRLLRDRPMDGEIRVTLEREPDASLAAAVEGEPHATIVARRRDGSLRGMGSRAVADAFVNGLPCRLGYLGQLRLDHGERRAGLLRLLAAGYDGLRRLRAPEEAPFDLTAVLADNRAARRLLGAGLPGLPAYVEVGAFTTLVVPGTRRRGSGPAAAPAPPGVRIERGDPARMPEVAACLERNRRRYQFAPRFSAAQLLSPVRGRGLSPGDFQLAISSGSGASSGSGGSGASGGSGSRGDSGGRVVGCLALWDQSGFKQVVVRGYGRRLALLRPALNGLSPLLGTPRLPAAGETLPHAFVSHVAVDGDDPEVFAALFAAARRAAAGRFLYLVAGFAARHPFLPVLRRRAREVQSVLYAVCWGEEGSKAVAALDGRMPHLEVALL
jgi:uncharacterized membrane protein YgcG